MILNRNVIHIKLDEISIDKTHTFLLNDRNT